MTIEAACSTAITRITYGEKKKSSCFPVVDFAFFTLVEHVLTILTIQRSVTIGDVAIFKTARGHLNRLIKSVEAKDDMVRVAATATCLVRFVTEIEMASFPIVTPTFAAV